MASYVYGNTARKESSRSSAYNSSYNSSYRENTMRKETAVPQHTPERPVKQPNHRNKMNQKKVLHMNRGYVMFLAVAAMVALFVCVKYLQLQVEVSNRSSNVTSLQQTLENKKEINNTTYNSIIDSVDLEEIRDRAMNELGMVYAKEGQIITYKDPMSNSVTQYSSIPESGIIAEDDTQ